MLSALRRVGSAIKCLRSKPPQLIVGGEPGKRFLMAVPFDLYYRYGPYRFVGDKVYFASRTHFNAFIIGMVIVGYWIQPFKGADYAHQWKSPRYFKRRAELTKSGRLDFNLKVKRDTWYLPHEEEGAKDLEWDETGWTAGVFA